MAVQVTWPHSGLPELGNVDRSGLALMMLVFVVFLREESVLQTPGLQMLHQVWTA